MSVNIVTFNFDEFLKRFLVKNSDNEKYWNTLSNLRLKFKDGSTNGFIDEIRNTIKASEGTIYFAGGFWRRIVENSPLKNGDIDLFFSDEKTFNEMRELLLYNNWEENSVKPHASTFTKTENLQKFEIQLISINYYNSITELFDDFDFTISQIALDPYTGHIVTGEFTLHDIAKKRLVLHKVKYGVAILRRLLKYASYGYYPCNGCLSAVVDGIRAIPDNDFLVYKHTYVD